MRHLITIIAMAGAVGSASATGLYGNIGSDGLGIGFGRVVSESVGLRGELNYGRLDYSFKSADIDYDATIKLKSAGVYGDWFPTPSAFRLTAGLNFNGSRIDATGTSDRTLIINGRPYSAAGEKVIATIEWPSVMPYIGIGFGHGPAAKGWGMFADLGVLIGSPKTTLSTTPGLASQVSSADLEAERRKLQEKADDYRVYPVLKIGVSYRF